jgi:hypothetical protein
MQWLRATLEIPRVHEASGVAHVQGLPIAGDAHVQHRAGMGERGGGELVGGVLADVNGAAVRARRHELLPAMQRDAGEAVVRLVDFDGRTDGESSLVRSQVCAMPSLLAATMTSPAGIHVDAR